MAADALGNPTRIVITAGQRGDVTQARALVAGMQPRAVVAAQGGGGRPKAVVADRGYDADELRGYLAATGVEVVIPPTASRARKPPYDRDLYRERNAVERLMGRLKQCRRVATRYEKTARNYGAFVHLAALLVLLR